MKIDGKRVLVTGAGGFIGSHLVEKLISKDCEVTAFTHYNSFNDWGWLDSLDAERRDRLKIFTGDIRDPNGVRNAIEGNDIVFHLAALVGIPHSYHFPDTYVDTNIKGTLNILQASRDLGVVKVIHTSTSEVYGTAQFVPITEEHPMNPQSPYAASKSGADFLALSFYRSFGTPVCIIRPFNTYGPRQSARAIIPTIILQILLGRKEINLGDLSPTRDLTYITDTVEGFICASESDAATGKVIHLGTGFEISIGNLAQKIGNFMHSEVNVRSEINRKRPPNSEVGRLLSDPSRARDIINWQALTSLDDGIQETINWFSNPNNRSRFKSDIYNI